MPKRKYTAEEIVNKLREAEVVIARGRHGSRGRRAVQWAASN